MQLVSFCPVYTKHVFYKQMIVPSTKLDNYIDKQRTRFTVHIKSSYKLYTTAYNRNI